MDTNVYWTITALSLHILSTCCFAASPTKTPGPAEYSGAVRAGTKTSMVRLTLACSMKGVFSFAILPGSPYRVQNACRSV